MEKPQCCSRHVLSDVMLDEVSNASSQILPLANPYVMVNAYISDNKLVLTAWTAILVLYTDYFNKQHNTFNFETRQLLLLI